MKKISDNLFNFLNENEFSDILQDLYYSENSNDYFDFSNADKSKISYLKGDRIPEDKSLVFDNEYRTNKAYHSKIGKLLSENVENSQIQKISSLLYARKEKENFDVFVTDKIQYYYHEENYSENHGTNGQLHNSCMRYPHLQNAIGFYQSLGKEKLELLVAVDNSGLLVGRCLFWHNVENEDGEKIDYLDRFFTSNDNITELFREYARENKILTRENKTSYLKIKINIDESIPLPYFDTFTSYDFSGYLKDGCGDIDLQSTEGESLEDLQGGRYSCCDCDTRMDEDNAYYSEFRGDYLCDCCGTYVDNENDFLPNDEVVYINGENYYKESDEIVYSDDEGEYILKEDAIYSEYHNEWFSSDNNNIIFSEYEDDYFHVDDVVHSEYEDDYFLLENVKYSNIENDYFKDENVKYSKFHNDYILEDNAVYIESFNDYFHIEGENIYLDDEGEYRHKQYLMTI